MKRALSCPDPEEAHSQAQSLKRRKTSSSDNGHDCLVQVPTSQAAEEPFRTPNAPRAPSPPPLIHQEASQFVEQWVKHCENFSELEMTPPWTPGIPSNDNSPRRASKLSYRRQRSRSPTKKSSTQYRSRNMADANVFVDHLPDPPSDLRVQLEHVFEVSSLDDVGQATPGPSALQRVVDDLVGKYNRKSRQMAKDCAGEGQWKSYLLTGLVEPLQEVWPKTLKLSVSEKPWIAELRPSPPSFNDILDGTLPDGDPSHESHRSSMGPQPLSTDILAQTPMFSAPSTTPSDVTTDDPNRISIPKPDIAVGLAHNCFSRLQGKILWDLQDSGRVLSEPHQSGIGLHFPFLVIEAKGLATGSNMVSAQNQAAVDGACALNILRDLGNAATGTSPPVVAHQPKARPMLFSVVTEGPIHEMWVHYHFSEGYHMTLLRIWRTTNAKDAVEFGRALAAIINWGANGFQIDIVKDLDTIEQELRQHLKQ